MSRSGLNVARRPFLNDRPVRRITRGFWIGGALLLLFNAIVYWQAWSGQNEGQNELARLEQSVVERKEREESLKKAIAGLRVEAMNERVGYLNSKLAERTFGWSQLFDRMSEVLPNDVRLQSLSPRFTYEEDALRNVVFTGERVYLQLVGIAKDGEAVLEFIDALFQHYAFEMPSISSETKTDRGEIDWQLSVVYLPTAVDPSADPDGEASSEEAEEAGDPVPSASLEEGSEPAEDLS